MRRNFSTDFQAIFITNRIVLGVGVKFYCKSSIRWNVCQWLRPSSGRTPCQVFLSSGSTSCDNVWLQNSGRPEYDDDISYETNDR